MAPAGWSTSSSPIFLNAGITWPVVRSSRSGLAPGGQGTALLDALEDQGLVARRPHTDDRRRNVVELTETGLETLRLATEARDEAERRFLSSLAAPAARQLKDTLRTLLTS